MKLTRHILPATLTLVGLCTGFSGAWAADINHLGNLNQAEFLALSKDLGAATSSKPMEPAAPLGPSGFDLSVGLSTTSTQAGSAWNKAANDGMGHLTQSKLMLTKGLPWGIDVGGFVAQFPNTNATASGVHLKYALVEGSTIFPALALRTGYSRMGGLSQMDLSNTSFDVLVSKGFTGFTPYAGVGTVRSNAKANGLNNLSNESFTQGKAFVGVSMNVMLFNLSAEYERMGSASTIGLKAGMRF